MRHHDDWLHHPSDGKTSKTMGNLGHESSEFGSSTLSLIVRFGGRSNSHFLKGRLQKFGHFQLDLQLSLDTVTLEREEQEGCVWVGRQVD